MATVTEIYAAAYSSKPFVEVTTISPNTRWVTNSNRVLVQPQERGPHGLRRRVRAADHERLQMGPDLEILESPAVHFEGEKGIDHAALAAWSLASLASEGREVLVHLARCRERVRRPPLVLWIVGHVAMDPFDQQVPILERKVEQPAGHVRGDAIRESPHDIDLPGARAIVEEIADYYDRGQPVLVGTISIENSEKLSKMLTRRKIKHTVLNAKYHQR